MPDSIQYREFEITGMSCGHCRSAVESAIREVAGVKSVNVDLERGRATVEGQASVPDVVQAVEESGYAATPVESK